MSKTVEGLEALEDAGSQDCLAALLDINLDRWKRNTSFALPDHHRLAFEQHRPGQQLKDPASCESQPVNMQQFVGKVVSNLMQKSVLVAIPYYKYVPKYKGHLRRTTKLMAHDENNACNMGDIVRVQHCKPISRRKRFTVTSIVKPANVYDPEQSMQAAAAMEEQARQRQRVHGLDMGYAANVLSATKKPGPPTWEE